jgi:dTDP-4-amino-4,6-dideoxygalactose transaminase
VSIPLLDLEAQHAAIADELNEAIRAVLEHRQFVAGPELERFEDSFASYCGAAHAVGVSSGTSALTVGLQAAGVGPGDEVITTPFTFIATVESIIDAGAEPVLVDPDPETALLDPERVEEAIGERTKALLAVHLFGQTVDLDAFRELADRHDLVLGEDAAQAHGAEWNGRAAGSVGDFGTFSFFPGKNLGGIGDGGAITTGDDEIARRAQALRNHGRAEKYRHDELGTNARLDTIQAAVLEVKLRHLPEWNEARRTHAAAYDSAFAGVDGVEPLVVRDEATHVYHQYVVRIADRDAALEAIRERGVGAGVHYPVPLNRQPALAGVADPDGFPNADRLASEVISLPVFPELTQEQQDLVVSAVAEAAKATSSAGVAR